MFPSKFLLLMQILNLFLEKNPYLYHSWITIVFAFYSYFWSKFEFNLGKSQSLLHPPIFPLISATSIFWESPILKISFPAFHSDIIVILPIVLQQNIRNTCLVFFYGKFVFSYWFIVFHRMCFDCLGFVSIWKIS